MIESVLSSFSKTFLPFMYCHSRESGNPFLQPDTKEMSSNYFVYIMATKKHGTLYIGVTNNLIRRVYEHKNDLIEGFTKTYSVHLLVYYEQVNDIQAAIQREKHLKKWMRRWKIELIEKLNPEWKDLYPSLIT